MLRICFILFFETALTRRPPLLSYTHLQSIDEGKVRKQIKLDSLPEVLILQLARFSYDYNKNLPIKVRTRLKA